MKLSVTLAAAVAACLLGQPASADPAAAPIEAISAGVLPTSYVQFRHFGHRHHGFRRGYGYRRGSGRGYGYRRGPGVGAAVGAGVAGLAAGAIIGGAIANSQAQAAQGAPGAGRGGVRAPVPGPTTHRAAPTSATTARATPVHDRRIPATGLCQPMTPVRPSTTLAAMMRQKPARSAIPSTPMTRSAVRGCLPV